CEEWHSKLVESCPVPRFYSLIRLWTKTIIAWGQAVASLARLPWEAEVGVIQPDGSLMINRAAQAATTAFPAASRSTNTATASREIV
ncbi:MAG: hypothetical protein MUO77_21475, partial [Anaerolineales bacterium]|nr:hypothetical protein [Anaerolineales bacterium]